MTGEDAFMAAAAARLREGGVAAFPTDTVTGLGCLASSGTGVAEVLSLKGRDARVPLIIFIARSDDCEPVTGPLDARVRRLLRLAWPGAFTAVLPLAGKWPAGVGRDGTIGIRVPAHPVPRALIALAGGALATTSANASGESPFRDTGEAASRWGSRVAVVPGKSGAVPSTVADLTAWPPRILREGGVSAAMLMELARAVEEPRAAGGPRAAE